jgi:hemerythrin
MALQWTPAMSTGVPELDAQHQELFRQVNALNDAMLQRQGAAKVVQTIDFLLDYAVKHFSAEEACMHRHNCPTAAANKKSHEAIKQVLLEKRRLIDQKGASSLMVIELKGILSDWLTTHIAAVDTRLKPCVSRPAA